LADSKTVQTFDYCDVTAFVREIASRPLLVILTKGGSAKTQQGCDNIEISIGGRQVQRSAAALVAGVNFSSVF
jgi:hypothetical protein